MAVSCLLSILLMNRAHMKRRILIVDDDEDILDLLKYNLEKEGYEVKALANGTRTLSAAKKFSPDLIILDIMMPGIGGIELCRLLRAKNRFMDTHIFFLTARSESYYQEAVYHTGGDDYIEKIMGLKSLTTKIRSVLKHNYVIRKSLTHLKVGKLQLNRRTTSATFCGDTVKLSGAEFELLFFFAQNPFRNISVDQLVQGIWGSNTYLPEINVEVYIRGIREKLGFAIIDAGKHHRYQLNVSLVF